MQKWHYYYAPVELNKIPNYVLFLFAFFFFLLMQKSPNTENIKIIYAQKSNTDLDESHDTHSELATVLCFVTKE